MLYLWGEILLNRPGSRPNPRLVLGFFWCAQHGRTPGGVSLRELVTVSEVKCNCMRVTECGKEAWSVNHEPMDKNQIEGDANQSERARNREAFVTKGWWRKSGGCVMKECVLTWEISPHA